MVPASEPREALSSLVSGWLLLMVMLAIAVVALQRFSLRVELVYREFYAVVRTDQWTGSYDVVPIAGTYEESEGLTLQEVITLKLGAWRGRPKFLFRAERRGAPSAESHAWARCIAECPDDYDACARWCDPGR